MNARRRLPVLLTLAFFSSACQDYTMHWQGSAESGEQEFLDEPIPIEGEPVAACAAFPGLVNPPFTEVEFDGSGSYDPDDKPLSYTWSLVSVPPGSSATIPSPHHEFITGFTPDLAGTYTARLTVTNTEGLSDHCDASLTAIPNEDLWVEMFWETPGDDMDLHFIAPGGSPSSNTDCYYLNCTGTGPDWGQPGNAGDNPRLDLDDVSGTGPENINIPAPNHGTYRVAVHDYPGSVVSQANAVTVNVYLGGILAWSDVREISGESTFEYFAEIDWPSGTITPL